nr:stAR-related lipid transfer protein 4 isoform X2 [Pogona vitticeps]
MADFPDVVSLATKVTNTVIQYYNIEDSEWRLAKKTKDTTVWRKPSEEFNGYLYKTQGIVEDVTNRIIDHIRPGPYRLHWDSLMTTMDIVDEFEDNCCVMRYTTAGQLWNIIAPREFIDFSCTTDYEDGLLSCGNVNTTPQTNSKPKSHFKAAILCIPSWQKIPLNSIGLNAG